MPDATKRDDAPLSVQLRAAHHDWIVPRWSAPACVQAFFTTRSAGDFGAAFRSRDSSEQVRRTRSDPLEHAVTAAARSVQMFLPGPPLWLEQVHGTAVIDADAIASTRAAPLPRGDGAVTRSGNVVIAVRVADCLPVLLCDRAGSVVAAAHAGWRGLAAGVLENTVAAMRCDPAGILAWLGPAIGARAFEVGGDVRDAFVAADGAAAEAFVSCGPAKWHADLALLAQRRLARAGVTDVACDGSCTWSESQRFYSFRRDRTKQRMAAFIWLTCR